MNRITTRSRLNICLVVLATLFMGQTTNGQTVADKTAAAPGEQAQESEKPQQRFKLTDDKTGIDVTLDGQLFTRYDYQTFAKPIFFPIHAPGQIEMTRNYPMKRVLGEQPDHPHQKSMWIGHEVNHLDFWTNRSGTIKNESIKINRSENSITATNHWNQKSNQNRIMKETTVYRFGASPLKQPAHRWIDATVTFSAADDDMVFNDTKEGLFAIRVHPDLRIKTAPRHGVTEVHGTITNSNGQTNDECWGQPAKWVDYSGPIEGQMAGIAIFDHPKNFRHPTRWHARGYGLVAANPFGLHHFAGAKKGTGEHRLKKGESLTLRYRVIFHAGNHESAKIESLYESFSRQ